MGKMLVHILILLLLVMSSCNSVKFFQSEKKHFHFEKIYSNSDSLFLADYIVYGISEKAKHRFKIQLNEDSLFNILKSSFSKQALNIISLDTNTNYDDYSFFSDEYFTYKNFNKSILFKSAINYPDKKLIFPVLLKYYKQRVHFDPSFFSCHITLAVFVVQNCEILYYRQVRHEEIIKTKNHPYEFDDFYIPIPLNKWDELVKEAMQPYIDRLK
jgi:hypothetical protein